MRSISGANTSAYNAIYITSILYTSGVCYFDVYIQATPNCMNRRLDQCAVHYVAKLVHQQCI